MGLGMCFTSINHLLKTKLYLYAVSICLEKHVAEPISVSTPQINKVILRASVVSARDNEGNKRQDNRYNKSEDFIAGITNVYVNVRGGCM